MEQGKPSGGTLVAPVKQKAVADWERGVAKYAYDPDEVRVCMDAGVTTKLHDRRRELAVTAGAKNHERQNKKINNSTKQESSMGDISINGRLML